MSCLHATASWFLYPGLHAQNITWMFQKTGYNCAYKRTHSYSCLLPWLLGDPAVVYRWRQGDRNSGGADVSDEDQGLFQSVIHPQHLVSPLGLLCRLLHQTALVCGWVQVGQQLRVDEVLRLETAEGKGKGFIRYADILQISAHLKLSVTNEKHTLLIMRCMMVLGMRSLMDLLTMPMYESTRLRMVSTCRSSCGSMDTVSLGFIASSLSGWRRPRQKQRFVKGTPFFPPPQIEFDLFWLRSNNLFLWHNIPSTVQLPYSYTQAKCSAKGIRCLNH